MCLPQFAKVLKVRFTYADAEYVTSRLLGFVDHWNKQTDCWADVAISDAEPSDDFEFSCEVEEEPTVWYRCSNLCCSKSTRWIIEGNESECHDFES